MSQQTIATTDSPETGRGKINANFTELYATALPVGTKKYVALLTQTGTSAPVATVLENTLGDTVVWGYSGVGSYTATLAGAFTQNKTTLFISNGIDPIGSGNYVGVERASADVIDVTSGVIITGDAANGIIAGTTIIITVYL